MFKDLNIVRYGSWKLGKNKMIKENAVAKSI